MKSAVKIHYGQYGFFLKVNGHAIKKDLNSFSGVKATPIDQKPNNWNATEFASIKVLREFWHSYMKLIIFEINK